MVVKTSVKTYSFTGFSRTEKVDFRSWFVDFGGERVTRDGCFVEGRVFFGEK